MARSVQASLPPMEVKPVVSTASAEDNGLVQTRRFLRTAIDESHWKHEAVAAAIAVDGPYLSKMLAGEKSITDRHLDALPEDIEARYYQRRAEACGFIVVTPVSEADAIKQLVGGLVGVLRRARVA